MGLALPLLLLRCPELHPADRLSRYVSCQHPVISLARKSSSNRRSLSLLFLSSLLFSSHLQPLFLLRIIQLQKHSYTAAASSTRLLTRLFAQLSAQNVSDKRHRILTNLSNVSPLTHSLSIQLTNNRVLPLTTCQKCSSLSSPSPLRA